MVKKYSIVEFSDGVQVIPSCWMNEDRSESAWPGHIKNLYRLNKLIIGGAPPEIDDVHHKWVTCPIIKWFGSTDTYKRAVEHQDKAMDTSTILDSDVVDEETKRKESKGRRKNHARGIEMSAAEAPFMKMKKKKKSKTRSTPVLDCENGFNPEHTCSSTPLRTNEERCNNVNEFPSLPAIDAIEISPEPVQNLLTASPSQQPNKEITSTFDYQEFMIAKAMQTSRGIKDITKKLERIEEKLSQRSENIENCERLFDEREFSLPVETEDGLFHLDAKLQDPPTFNNIIYLLKRSGGPNVAMITSTILGKLVESSVAEKYSWHGRKQKKPFTNFINIVKLILSSVHATCREMQYKCTDADIIHAAGKWLAQTKTRIMRAQVRMNKGYNNAFLSQATYSGESHDLQQPSSANAVQPSPGNTLQPSLSNELQPSI